MTRDGLLTLTVNYWEGTLPRAGHYLRTLSGRTAYLIVEVVMPKRLGTRYVARLLCEREAPGNIPEGAPCHTWEWGKREKAARVQVRNPINGDHHVLDTDTGVTVETRRDGPVPGVPVLTLSVNGDRHGT